MGFTYSPLRYPGGKSRLRQYITEVIQLNDLHTCHYVEPFAGGAGLAWSLLIDDLASQVHINDLDPAIYAFWHSVLYLTDDFCQLVSDTEVTMDQWRIQRRVYENQESHSYLERGFATFFLNRTNRSGIIRGGVIGGMEQSGKWRMDARFNKSDLIKRIQRIASFRDNVSVSNQDAIGFLREKMGFLPDKTLIFIDPPYISRGKDLYMNRINPGDHEELAEFVANCIDLPWIVAYDNAPTISEMYDGFNIATYDMSYSAQSRYHGKEVLITPDGLNVPVEVLST